MKELHLKLPVDARALLLGKFADTFGLLDGFLQEVKSDIRDHRNYTPEAVESRLQYIYDELLKELTALSKELIVSAPKRKAKENGS